MASVPAWGGAPKKGEKMLATSTAPARHCISHPPSTLRALKLGHQNLAVVVKAFQPTIPPTGTLVVWLLTAPPKKRIELARFALHPLRPFTRSEPRRTQRFLVSLSEQSQLIKDGQPLCLEVGFDPSLGKLEGGLAELEIEVVKTER